MNKEEALDDFLRGLRIALNNASVYSKDHPYYLKSVENLKQNLDNILVYLNPIKINIAPAFLLIDGKFLEKATVYLELASFFHLRKIKSIEFREGINAEELTEFLSSASRPRKEILREGGLKVRNNSHIQVEELDYSELLRGAGGDDRDVWAYLFKHAIKKQDHKEINEFADKFESIIKNFRLKDFAEDEGLREDLYNFLLYLKTHNRDKFKKCVQEMFKSLLRYKDLLEDQKFEKIRSLFKDLDLDNFSGIFWDQLSSDENFDILSFQLFSRLAGEERQKEIASSLFEKAPNKESLRKSPELIKRMQGLLSSADSQAVSASYRSMLTALLKDISFEKALSFDRKILNSNYRYLILNLLVQEKSKKRLNLILEKLSAELPLISEERDFDYLRKIIDVLGKRKDFFSFISASQDFNMELSKIIESLAWEEGNAIAIDLIDKLDKSWQGADFYLNKIFNEKRITACGLKLFLRLFPERMPYFYESLERMRSDVEFMVRIIDSLKKVDLPAARAVLKKIFFFSNEVIKIEILKAMQEMPELDEEFLFSILRQDNLILKKAAMVALAGDRQLRRKAIELILTVGSPLGIKNNVLLDNILIVDDLGLTEATSYLTALSEKKFFWNRKVRNKAQDLLRKWYAR